MAISIPSGQFGRLLNFLFYFALLLVTSWLPGQDRTVHLFCEKKATKPIAECTGEEIPGCDTGGIKLLHRLSF